MDINTYKKALDEACQWLADIIETYECGGCIDPNFKPYGWCCPNKYKCKECIEQFLLHDLNFKILNDIEK